ncbi:MAG: diphthine--ammonia ligase [archaeon]|jgi:asparagine synthase (glutamine-hydrolysing)
MCGIIGFANFKDSESLAKKGLEAISYRGTDHSKVVYHDNLTFGHNLHSVVDFVVQPLESTKGILVINCEIYNWKQLAKKYKLKVKNDAELVLALLDSKPFKALPKIIELFDGDYAFSYYSKKENKLLLARDIIGVKPLVYFFDEKTKKLAFASEKKALNVSNLNAVNLNPRQMILFDLAKNSLTFVNRKLLFKKSAKSTQIKKSLFLAVEKRIPDAVFGLLLSGGLDSSLIGKIIKKQKPKTKFVGLFAGVFDPVAGLGEPKDYESAEKVAKLLGCEFVAKKVFVPDFERELPKIISLIESTDPVRVGVASTIYFATKEASALGLKVVMSGLGADELFAGYFRFKESNNINKDCYSYLIKMYENDLYFEDIISMANKLEMRLPYLDRDLVEKSIYFNSKQKIAVDKKTKLVVNKKILRDVALGLKIPVELALREKKAAQYGSNFDKAIEYLAKKNGFKSKADYLKSISSGVAHKSLNLSQKNIPIAALLSTGKDSVYALHLMEKQGYDVRCLISINPQNKDSFMYHSPTIELAKLQAKALGKKLLLIHSKGEKETELAELERGLMLAKKMFGIEGVCSGALFSNYQRERIERACECNGLRHFAPLWHMNQENYLRNLIKSGFNLIITKIACMGMSEKWLGREIDTKAIEELVLLNKKYGVNVAGEGGEYESLVLDAPLFKEKIIVEFEKKMQNEITGEIEIKKAELKKK